ncbi:MAG: low molecular weight protein arginine phosphatase [Clostridia bacterium]|nr:low molecular weight protein arginine phosphatase [Clostridia bacterium]
MNVLFVCTGNTCRSPMAAALFNKIATKKDLPVRIESAGIFANDGETASSQAITAMKEYGIDLSEHRAKTINQELLEECDLVLTMTNAHKMMLKQYLGDKVYTLMEFAGENGDVPDPYGKDTDEYKKCAESLYEALLKVADKI